MHRPVVLCLLLAGMSSAAVAQDTLPPLDRFYVGAGRYGADHDLDTRWDASDGSMGTHLDFQRDLGFVDRQDALVWNIGGSLGEERRHAFDAFGYDYGDDTARLLDRTLQIGDNAYPVDADLEGSLDLRITGVSYTWFFHHDGQRAFGVGLGAMRYDVDIELDATATVAGSPVAYANILSEDEWAPMLRAEYAQAVSAHWRWGASLAYTKKTGGTVTGDARDVQPVAARRVFAALQLQRCRPGFRAHALRRQPEPQQPRTTTAGVAALLKTPHVGVPPTVECEALRIPRIAPQECPGTADTLARFHWVRASRSGRRAVNLQKQ